MAQHSHVEVRFSADASVNRHDQDKHVVNPVINGRLEHHIDTDYEGASPVNASHSLTESISANESSCLLVPDPTLPSDLPQDDSVEKPRLHSICSPPEDPDVPVSVPPVSQPHLQTLQSTSYTTQYQQHKRPPSIPGSTKSLKTSSAQIEQLNGDELCASLVLSCLFCHLWDCVLALGEGCHLCLSSLCSSLCSHLCCCCFCAGPPGPEPLLEVQGCVCGGPLCDGSALDLCLHADCCARCILACLFCEWLSACSLLLLPCGSGCEEVCCCCLAHGRTEACGAEACCEGLDCNPCETPSCLELCLECCSVCLSA